MKITASFFAAILPMTFYLVLLYRTDKYEREPLTDVVLHFFWGALGAVIFSILFSYVFNISTSLLISDETSLTLYSTIFIAPFVEEIGKGLILLKTYRKSNFDNVTDGLVYGGDIGLGFGMPENLLYFIMSVGSISSWLILFLPFFDSS